MKSKVIALLAGAMVSLFVVAGYVTATRARVPLGWMLYLGLPLTGAGVAVRTATHRAGRVRRRTIASRMA